MNEHIGQIVNANAEQLGTLCRECGVEKLFLFGSASGAGWTTGSDIDIGAVLAPGSDKSKLHEGLCSIFGQSVHLSDVRSIVNPYLRQVILSGHRIF